MCEVINTDNVNDLLENELINPTTQQAHAFAHNKYIGTKITEEKGDGVFRIHCGNPNGLKLDSKGGELAAYLEEMKRMSVDTVCIYELNLDTTRGKVQKTINDTCYQIFDHVRVNFSSSTIRSQHEYKPGGTLILSQGDTTGRIHRAGTDEMGRWTFQTMIGKNFRNLTIISAYQVCKQKIKVVKEGQINQTKISTTTATAQQTSMLRQRGRHEEPRNAFIKDIRRFIISERAKGNGILLVGDFNEHLGASIDGMTKLTSDLNLTDLMYQAVGDDNFQTYVRGSKRIDYALCDEWVQQAMIAACYEPFKHKTKGDHRNMVIDFDVQKLFGNATYNLATPSQREFSTKDKAANQKYIEEKFKFLESRGYGKRLQKGTTNWTPKRAEQLDNDFQRAGKTAAKSCKKKPNIAYVRKISSLRVKKNVLMTVISQHRLGMDFSDAIENQVKEGNDFLIPDTLEECKAELRTTQQAIYKMAEDATTHRRNELKTEETKRKSAGDKKGAKAINQIIRAENTANMFRKFQRFRGTQKGGLSTLEVPRDTNERDYDNCKEWISVDTPKDVEEKLRDNKQIHFGQAQGSFPTVPPFSEWVDWGASSHQADLILEGEFKNSEIDELAQDLIRHMMKRTDLDEIEGELTREEWIGKIKAWPERTSTSPSGFHLTHSKALVSPHDLDLDTPAGQELEVKRNLLIDWQVELINQAIRNKYSYERWKTIVNVMILKEPGNVKVHRLRVIHLYEHDYNLVLAVKWRSLIQSANSKGLLNAGQFGGVPGKDAITPTIIEELQYEICRASKRPLLHMDYDATACYDRIIMNLGGLASRAFGQNKSVVFINAKTLQEAKYYMKTKLGVSEAFYQHSTIFPIYGSGQGSGNSPGLWCVISSILFDLYEENANGATFQSPDGKEKIQLYMIGFVDDTSSSINDFTQPVAQPPQHYADLATKDAQRWNDVLKLSGGALNNIKCSYHFLYYDFTVSGLAVLRGGKFDPTIEIKFNSGTTTSPLKQLSAHQTHKTLGCQKSPAGKEKMAFAKVKANVTTHSTTVARCPFNRTDTWSYYHAILIPSSTFVFPSSTISDKQCNELQVQIKQAVLPKYGFNRNMPLGVVYGNSEYAGIDMRTLSTEKGLAQLQSLISCLRSDGIPNKLALIAISWAQMLAGTSTPIFQECTQRMPHLDPMRWLPAIRDFLGKIDGSLDIKHNFVVDLQRENDRHIMDIVLKEMNFKPIEEQYVNVCRLYQGVTLLSCITNAAGTAIRGEIFAGEIPTESKFKGLMPYQDNPSETAWSQWRKVLKYVCKKQSTLVKEPLGKWIKTSNELHREWNFFIDQEYTLVYKRKNEHFECYELDQGNTYVTTGVQIQRLPIFVVPIDVDDQDAYLHISPHCRLQLPPVVNDPITFQEHVATLEQWEQELMSDVEFIPCVYTFVRHIKENLIVHCTSDGSAPQFVGSFGWVSSLPGGERIARNKGPAYGFRTTSYRTEGYGILSYLRLVYRAFEFTADSLPTSLVIHTDSESVLKQVLKMIAYPFYFANMTLTADWDVVQAIISTLRKFPVQPKLLHVKGHQDRNRSFESLPLPAQLNIEADALAGAYQYTQQQNHTVVPRIAGNTVQLHLPEGTITSKLKSAVRKCASLPLTRKAIQKSNKWTEYEFDSIAWEAHGTCFRKHYHRKHFLVKYIHDWLPLGKQVSRYQSHYLAKCPSCDHEQEDRNHFLRCPARKQWQSTMIKEIRSFLSSFPTRPAFAKILIDGIRKWLADQPIHAIHYPQQYRSMIVKQTAAGWNQIFLGRFVKEWIGFQEDSLRTISNRKPKQSGTVWLQGIITIIWQHVSKEWETRNKARHGHDAATQEIARFEQAKRETIEIYATRNEILPEYQDVFYDSLEEHFAAEPTSRGLRQWLDTWQSTVTPDKITTTIP